MSGPDLMRNLCGTALTALGKYISGLQKSMNICRQFLSHNREGYTLLVVVFAVTVLTIGLLVAIPVWETQLQREKEAELIFRGLQYVEAVRIYQEKNPGRFPQSLEELLNEDDDGPKYIRKLYPDPMTEDGEWNVILQSGQTGGSQAGNMPGRRNSPAGRTSSQAGAQQGSRAPSKVLVGSQSAAESLPNPQIIGVVSSSKKSSKKIYLEQDSYDKWLFFHGMDPENIPEVEYVGKKDDEDES